MITLPTPRQLRYLCALADHLHFGRAAAACAVTQSTLSAGIQELEAMLGVTLVERTKRRVMLTPLGRELALRARQLLRDSEDMVALARSLGEPLAGELRLGVIPTIGPYLRSEEHTSELQSHRDLHSFPTRRSSDLAVARQRGHGGACQKPWRTAGGRVAPRRHPDDRPLSVAARPAADPGAPSEIAALSARGADGRADRGVGGGAP